MIYIYYIILLLVLFLSAYIQKNIDKNRNENIINTSNLDILKYISALIIIILHIKPFYKYNSTLDFIFNDLISKICVPLFFTITGYFICKKEHDNPKYIKNYLKKILIIYLVWSLIYLPVSIKYSAEYAVNVAHPFYFDKSKIIYSLVVGILYSGLFYHLWYFPALILAVILLYILKKKINIKIILLVSFILLIIGSFESYYGLLPYNIKNIFDSYLNIFYTTTNGLFFGLFYISLGYYLGSMKKINFKASYILLLFFTFLLVVEAKTITYVTSSRGDILITVPLFIVCLFNSFIYISSKIKNTIKLRELTKYYYLIHPLVIVIYIIIAKGKIDNPLIKIPCILVTTHLLSVIVIKFKAMFIKA